MSQKVLKRLAMYFEEGEYAKIVKIAGDEPLARFCRKIVLGALPKKVGDGGSGGVELSRGEEVRAVPGRKPAGVRKTRDAGAGAGGDDKAACKHGAAPGFCRHGCK